MCWWSLVSGHGPGKRDGNVNGHGDGKKENVNESGSSNGLDTGNVVVMVMASGNGVLVGCRIVVVLGVWCPIWWCGLCPWRSS